LAIRFHEQAKAHGIDYISLGPTTAQDDPEYTDAIAAIVRTVPEVFASVEIANRDRD